MEAKKDRVTGKGEVLRAPEWKLRGCVLDVAGGLGQVGLTRHQFCMCRVCGSKGRGQGLSAKKVAHKMLY